MSSRSAVVTTFKCTDQWHNVSYLGCASDTQNFVIRQKRLSEPLHTKAPSPPPNHTATVLPLSLWVWAVSAFTSHTHCHTSYCDCSIPLSVVSWSVTQVITLASFENWFLYMLHLIVLGVLVMGGAVLKTFIFSQAVCLHLWYFKEHFVHHTPFSEACYRLMLSHLIIPFPLE